MKKKNEVVITVVGQDRVGIIAGVTSVLASVQINIKDITQTILESVFTMIMLVDLSDLSVSMEDLDGQIKELEKELNVHINLQHIDVYNVMHRI